MNMRAFTLIETLVYIALWSFIMSGVMLAVYGIAQNSDLFSRRSHASEEGEFVVAKLKWALGNASSVTTPASGYSSTLNITENDGTVIEMRLSGSAVEMRVGGGAYEPLTTANVSVSALGFMRIPGTPTGIEASTTISGVSFMARRYLLH